MKQFRNQVPPLNHRIAISYIPFGISLNPVNYTDKNYHMLCNFITTPILTIPTKSRTPGTSAVSGEWWR